MADRLAEVVSQLAAGGFPPADGVVEVVPAPSRTHAAVLAFTGHHVVAADVDPAWVAQQVAADTYTAPVSARFLHALGDRVGHHAGSLDIVLVARSLEWSAAPLALRETDERTHPRVARAGRYRDSVRAWETVDGSGVITLGRGLGQRWEASYELDSGARGQGIGRLLATAARHLVPTGESVFVAVAPGNVASLRATLSAGFEVVGAEVLFGGRTDAQVVE